MPLLSTLASASARGYGFNLSVSNSEDENATGVSATGGVGSITATTTNFISTTGVSATASAGAATVQITDSSETVNLTGVSSSTSVGNVTVTFPPADQYFATMYIYSSSSTSYGRAVQVWRWSPSTNSVSKTGGLSSGGYVTAFNSSLLSQALTGGSVAATSSINSSNQWLVFTVSGGSTSTVIDKYAINTDGTLPNPPGRTTAYTESNAGVSYTQGIHLSIGTSDQRLGFVWSDGAAGCLPRVFTLDKDAATLTLRNPINAPNSSYHYRSTAVHPTEDVCVINGSLTTGTTSNGFIYLYSNYGSSGSETRTTYSVTGQSGQTAYWGFGFDAKWSRSGNYLAISSNKFVYVYSYAAGTLTLLSTLDPDAASNLCLEWGPSDNYILVSGGSGYLATIARSGSSFSITSQSYPNAAQNQKVALNYNGSALFGPTDYASDNTNMRVFLMNSNNLGLPSSLAVSQTVANSSDPSGYAHYYGTVALPPLEE